MVPDNITFVSNLVKNQFPDFYKQDGDNFIAFLEAYYQWMEQEEGLITQSRQLLETNDIDLTADKFLDHFKQKYMRDLPVELIGNQRLFQKHILELYRSKGSDAGLKLFFRLLYNEDVDTYVPSYDIFKTSDAVWKQPTFIEVSYSPLFWQFQGKIVYGGTSGAKAVVENVEMKTIGTQPVYLINISNIFGTFEPGESLLYKGIDPTVAPTVLGSPVDLTVRTSTANFAVGDIVVDTDSSRQKPLKVVVSETYDSVGIIQFSIVDGGDYYSTDAEVTITAGSNTTGIGADFIVFSIANTSTFQYSTEKILPFANTLLKSNAYGFAANASAKFDTLIKDSIGFATAQVGTIDVIATTNPGTGYDGSVTVTVVDPYTSTRGIYVGNGEYGGLNADIDGDSITGTGLIKDVRIHDAGHGYNLDGQSLTMVDADEPTKFLTGHVVLGDIGRGEGYFDDTKSFASADKYLFDGHYYQNYSYVIKTTRSIENFIDVLKNTVHPAGNAVYSITRLRQREQIDIEENSHSVVQAPFVPSSGDFVANTFYSSGILIAPGSAYSLTRASSKYSLDVSNTYSVFANNVLAVAPVGAFVETSANNLVIRSTDISNAAWTKTALTITAGANTAPLGTKYKVAPTAANTNHVVASPVWPYFIGNQYTVTVIAEAAGYNFIRLNFSGDFSPAIAWLDLSLGIVDNVSVGTANIQNLGNGRYACSLTSLCNATGSQPVALIVAPSVAAGLSFLGDGTSGIYLHGTQIEIGTKFTSYIPTTTVGVTRAADALTINGAGLNDWNLTLDDDSIQTFSNITGNLVIDPSTLNRTYIKSYGTVPK